MQRTECSVQTFQAGLARLFIPQTPMQREAWEALKERGLPQPRVEAFRYLPLATLYGSEWTAPQPQQVPFQVERQDYQCVLFNGNFHPEYTGAVQGVVALPLALAAKNYGSFLKKRMQHQIRAERNPFALLNTALHGDGLFLYIPPHTVLERPLEIVCHYDALGALVSPRIHVVLGAHAAATLVVRGCMHTAKTWVNAVWDIALEEGAALTRYRVADYPAQSTYFESLRVSQKKQSRLTDFTCTQGAHISRFDVQVHLKEPHSEVVLQGIWGLYGERQHHTYVRVEHEAPECHSLQHFKGILKDHSRASFEGKIYVHPEAQKTQAYQRNHNLLLDPTATVYSKPNLEIFADDVKASHGATVGQLDAEHLHYLTARGIPQAQARALLVRGFYEELLQQIPLPAVRAAAAQLLARSAPVAAPAS